MTITTTIIFNHSTPNPLTKLPQHFNPALALWEHLLNQKYPADYIRGVVERLGAVYAFSSLIKTLLDSNNINICHPETGEIIWSLNTTTGEEEP